MRPVTPSNEASDINIPVNKRIRPKKGEKVKFQVMNEDTMYEGIVSQVGKTTGKDKNRCWIKFTDGTIKSFDFTDEIQEWKTLSDEKERYQEEDNMNVTYYTEYTDKDVKEKEDEILREEIEKYIWVDNKSDVLLTRKNCDMNLETRKDEAGEDCQLPDSLHHNSDLYKRYDYANICSFQ